MAYPVINRCLVPLLLGLVLLPASAETLEQAWSQALGSSRTLKAEARKVDAASEQRHAAQAAAGPVVSLQGNWLKLEREPKARMDLSPLTSGLPLPLRGLLPGSMEASLSDDQVTLAEARISLPVYTSGRLTHLQDAAQAAEQAAQYGEERTRQDVKLDVAEAYFNVLRARDAEQVARELLTSLSAYRRDVGNFYQKGLVARGDVLGADVAVADARQKLIAAGQAASVARAAYNRLLGRPFGQPVSLAEVNYPRERRSLPQLTGLAENQRPELAALAAWSSSLEAKAKSVKAEAGPQVGVFASYTYLDNRYLVNKGLGAAGVGVTWTPFDSGLTRAKAGSVVAEAEAVKEQREDARTLVQLDVQRAVSLEVDAAERLQVAQTALASANEYLTIQRDRYRNGLANQTEVLAAETRRADSQRNLYTARYDHALAVVRLKRATGEL